LAKSKKKKEPSKPPQPPKVDKKFQIHAYQWIGIPLMMLIPILALLGLFGETVDMVSSSSQLLDVSVEYPTRFRYKMIDEVTVSLANVSEQTLPSVLVRFDRQYIDGFSTVTFTPSIKATTESDYLVEVSNLQPGETRVITATIQAEKYGMHRGSISTGPEDGGELEVSIATFTFP
jgi:hypothetical protein